MAKALNKVMLIGNIGKEPVLEYLPNGNPVLKLSIATSESFKNKSEEWEEQTEWHKVVMYGKFAEYVSGHTQKGSKIYIEGKLKTRSWDDKDSKKHYMTEVVCNDAVILEGAVVKAADKPRPANPKNNDPDDTQDCPF